SLWTASDAVARAFSRAASTLSCASERALAIASSAALACTDISARCSKSGFAMLVSPYGRFTRLQGAQSTSRPEVTPRLTHHLLFWNRDAPANPKPVQTSSGSRPALENQSSQPGLSIRQEGRSSCSGTCLTVAECQRTWLLSRGKCSRNVS